MPVGVRGAERDMALLSAYLKKMVETELGNNQVF